MSSPFASPLLYLSGVGASSLPSSRLASPASALTPLHSRGGSLGPTPLGSPRGGGLGSLGSGGGLLSPPHLHSPGPSKSDSEAAALGLSSNGSSGGMFSREPSLPSSPRGGSGGHGGGEDGLGVPRFVFSFSAFEGARGGGNDINPSAMLLPCRSGPPSRSNSGHQGLLLGGGLTSGMGGTVGPMRDSHSSLFGSHQPRDSLFALNSDGSGASDSWAHNSMDLDVSTTMFDVFPPILSHGGPGGGGGPIDDRGGMPPMRANTLHSFTHTHTPSFSVQSHSPSSTPPKYSSVLASTASSPGFHTPTSSNSMTASSPLSALLAQSNHHHHHNLEGNVALQRKLESLYLQQNQQGGHHQHHQQQPQQHYSFTPEQQAHFQHQSHHPPSHPQSPLLYHATTSRPPIQASVVHQRHHDLSFATFPPPPPRSADTQAVLHAAALATKAGFGAPVTRASVAASRAGPVMHALLPTPSSSAGGSLTTSSDSSPSTSTKSRSKFAKVVSPSAYSPSSSLLGPAPTRSSPSSSSASSSATASPVSRPASSSSRRRNNGEPYLCPLCNKTFTQKGGLANHSRIHRNEKPFACQVQGCTRAFAQKCNLTRHARCHTGEKPFKCPEVNCDRAFNRRWGLLVHSKSHAQGLAIAPPKPRSSASKPRRTAIAKVTVLPLVSTSPVAAAASTSFARAPATVTMPVARGGGGGSSLLSSAHVPSSFSPSRPVQTPQLASQLASLHHAASAFMKPIKLEVDEAPIPGPGTHRSRASPRTSSLIAKRAEARAPVTHFTEAPLHSARNRAATSTSVTVDMAD